MREALGANAATPENSPIAGYDQGVQKGQVPEEEIKREGVTLILEGVGQAGLQDPEAICRYPSF